MDLTNPSRALGRFSLLSTSPKVSALSSILPFFTSLFRLAFISSFARWTRSFLSNRLTCVVFQNHKIRSFRVSRSVPQGSILGPVLFSSSIILLLLCVLPSAAFFMLTIWQFGPPPHKSLLLWRLHKNL